MPRPRKNGPRCVAHPAIAMLLAGQVFASVSEIPRYEGGSFRAARNLDANRAFLALLGRDFVTGPLSGVSRSQLPQNISLTDIAEIWGITSNPAPRRHPRTGEIVQGTREGTVRNALNALGDYPEFAAMPRRGCWVSTPAQREALSILAETGISYNTSQLVEAVNGAAGADGEDFHGDRSTLAALAESLGVKLAKKPRVKPDVVT